LQNLRAVPNFPKYQVDTDNGLVYSSRRNCVVTLNPTLSPSGYLTLTLYNNGKSKSTTVHCVVMAAHLGTWDWEKPEVDHKDHNRQNNSISNLQLATRSEQMDDITNSKLSKAMKGNTNHDKEALSKAVRGERNNKAKLTEKDVIAIREAFDSLGHTVKSAFVKEKAVQYKVSESAIYRVLSKKFWKII
jgi:hypothetical protein